MRGRCSRSARSADTRRCRWRPVWPLVDGSPPARSPRCMPSSPAATSRPARMPTASTWWSARPSSPSPSWRAPSTWSSSMPTRPPTATTSRQCFPNSPHVVSSPPTTRCGAAGSSTRPTPPRTRWPSASSTMPWPSTRGWSWSRPPSATESLSSAGQPDTPGFPLWPPVVDGAPMLSKGPSTTVLDYHLHLWPHSQRDAEATIEQVAAYCGRAVEAGVEEIALTEHLFRFTQAKELLGGFWDDLPGEALRPGMAAYWDHHARVDLDIGVEVHPGVVIPVGGHSRAERLAGKVVPEPAQKLLGLGEPEEVLGEGDLLHPRLDGATAVSRHLLDGGLGITLRVGPEVKVVVQHGRTRSFREHGRSVHNGRPEREAGGVRLPGG